MRYNKGNIVVELLVIAALIAVIASAGYYVGTQVSKPAGAIAGPESTNDYQCYNGVCTYYRSGSFVSASSTVFSVKNPLAATTTARIVLVVGTGNATSTNLLMGTSTAATGLSASSVSPTFANVTIGTSSPKFSIASGVTTGLLSTGVTTAGRIIVAPGEYVSAEATSTYGNAGALNYVPGLTGTYRIEFER